MLKIGITGTIGSGKSTVAAILACIGRPVYDSDCYAKKLMNGDLKLQLTKIVGQKLFDRTGAMDRHYLATRLFLEPLLKSAVEAIVHPAIVADFQKWAYVQNAPYVVLESALLFSSPSMASVVDYTVAVTCPTSLAVQRAASRDGVSAAQIESRMAHQMSSAQMAQLANYEISTNEKELLVPKVVALDNIFINFAMDFNYIKTDEP